MPEKTAADRMAEVATRYDDPVAAQVGQLGTAFAESVQQIERQIEQVGNVSSEAAARMTKELDKFKAQVEAGLAFQRDRIEVMEKRMVAQSYMSPTGVKNSSLLEAISPDERQTISVIRSMSQNQVVTGEMADPLFRAAATLWFKHSTLAQLKKGDASQEHVERCRKLEKGFEDAYVVTKAALSTTDAMGGHWLPDPVQAELWRLIYDNSVVRRSGARAVTMTSKTLDLPIEGASGLSVTVASSENTIIADSVPAGTAVDKVTLTARRFNGRAVSSLEEVQDSPISILGWVQDKLTELIGRYHDTEALEGTGTTFTGVVAATGVNVANPAAGANGDTLTYVLLAGVPFAALERSTREGARWFVSPKFMAKVVALADTTGQPIFQFGKVPGEISLSILGYPTEVHGGILSNRTKGTGTTLTNAYFGPPNTLVFGDRTGMAWDVSTEAGSAFENYSVVMRLVARTGFGVAVPKAWTKLVDIVT